MSVTIALTIKQRRFLKHYLKTGNGTQAALVAYDVTDANTARSIATENLRKPALRTALAALLDAEQLSNRALRRIHAHYLALYASPDPREQALGLKALHLAYRVTGAYAPCSPDPRHAARHAQRRRRRRRARVEPGRPARRQARARPQAAGAAGNHQGADPRPAGHPARRRRPGHARAVRAPARHGPDRRPHRRGAGAPVGGCRLCRPDGPHRPRPV